MFPSKAFNNWPKNVWINLIFNGHSLNGSMFSIIFFSKFKHFFLGKPTMAVSFSNCRSFSSHHIISIFLSRSKIKMLWVSAKSVIAFMQDHQTIRNVIINYQPRNPMSTMSLFSNSQYGIAIRGFTASPFPASFAGYNHIFQINGFKGLSKKRGVVHKNPINKGDKYAKYKISMAKQNASY